jgi:hypothetical protein
MTDGISESLGGVAVTMLVTGDTAKDPDGGWWVSAERFAAARSTRLSAALEAVCMSSTKCSSPS